VPTQVDYLREQLAISVTRRGPDAPMTKALRQQLSSLESRESPPSSAPNPITLHVGMRSAPKDVRGDD